MPASDRCTLYGRTGFAKDTNRTEGNTEIVKGIGDTANTKNISKMTIEGFAASST